MNLLLLTYNDMLMSLHQGFRNGIASISKPLYILSIIEAIEYQELTHNRIEATNQDIRNRFGFLFEKFNGNKQGYGSAFYNRPFYHLDSSDFYHLVWKDVHRPSPSSNTPSAKYLREHLLYAKLDDELWELLQSAENRDYFRKNIINRYLKQQA